MPAAAASAMASPLVDSVGTGSDITTVSIVDDEIDRCELPVEFARTQGLRVATAHDDRAAGSHPAKEFDSVITDLHLPGADGFDVPKTAQQ